MDKEKRRKDMCELLGSRSQQGLVLGESPWRSFAVLGFSEVRSDALQSGKLVWSGRHTGRRGLFQSSIKVRRVGGSA